MAAKYSFPIHPRRTTGLYWPLKSEIEIEVMHRVQPEKETKFQSQTSDGVAVIFA